MTPLSVRPANPGDLPALAAIYRAARAFMAASGNPTQWGTTDPRPELLRQDIAQEQLYVLCDGDTPRAAFALVPGEDPTYAVIDGAWLSDAPYATIHRLGSDGTCHGVFASAIGWAAARQPHLRIDTHADNHIMQKLIARAGFRCCGIIHVADGSPRLAYERLPG
ncbi:GNAT family protein [uncultured Subdoligranulum sp.]|uniref:GNAT family N-acetyltransferase n=1 Tax=uncultured Subdoligranulum sp. TaxID=512298 RepID=UPI00320847BB